MMQAVVLPLLLVTCEAGWKYSGFRHDAKPKSGLLQKSNIEETKPKKADLKVKSAAATESDKWVSDAEKALHDNPKSNMKLTVQEIEKIESNHSSGKMRDVGPLDKYIDMWYVNLKESKDRKECMDKQIEEMGMESHRFQGFNFKRCAAWEFDDIQTCLKKKKYGDCVAGGLNFGSIATHGSASNSENERKYHIVSNWCGHKRMMAEMLEQHKKTKSTKKYAVILEDDVAFNRKEFMRKVVNFCETYDGKYNETWTMVQIDPFGSKCDKHIVGYFEGLPVWKPRNINNGWACSNYWGAQALLVKYSAIPEIIEHMEKHETVPLDWLPGKLDHGLAWRANIALNPEASKSVHMKVTMPQYCKSSIKQSTIGFREKRSFSLAQTSGANPLDVAKIDEVVVDPEDVEYEKLVDAYNSYDPEGTYTSWMTMQENARADLKKYGIN